MGYARSIDFTAFVRLRVADVLAELAAVKTALLTLDNSDVAASAFYTSALAEPRSLGNLVIATPSARDAAIAGLNETIAQTRNSLGFWDEAFNEFSIDGEHVFILGYQRLTAETVIRGCALDCNVLVPRDGSLVPGAEVSLTGLSLDLVTFAAGDDDELPFSVGDAVVPSTDTVTVISPREIYEASRTVNAHFGSAFNAAASILSQPVDLLSTREDVTTVYTQSKTVRLGANTSPQLAAGCFPAGTYVATIARVTTAASGAATARRMAPQIDMRAVFNIASEHST